MPRLILSMDGLVLKEIPLTKAVKSGPPGVTRLIELQEQGWSYLRP